MKKILLSILVSSLILSCAVPAYAATTVVKPESSSDGFHKYSWGESTGSNLSSSTQSVSTWSDMVNLITQSIAYSIKSMSDRNHYDMNFISGQLSQIISNVGSGSNPSFWIQDSNHVGLIPSEDSPLWSSTDHEGAKRVLMWNLNPVDAALAREDFLDVPLLLQYKLILNKMNTNISRCFVRLTYHVSTGDFYLQDFDGGDPIPIADGYGLGSLWDTTLHGFSNLSYGLSKLVYIFASPEDIAAKEASENNVTNFTDNFIDPQGSNSASVSDFNSVGSIGSNLKESLTSGASASGSFGAFSNSDGKYNWFSQDTMDQLDTVSNSRTLRSSNSGFTNFVGEHYNEVRRGLDVD